MPFSTSATPITASGSSAEYTHTFKKHFGDRPVAFALSTRSYSPSSNTQHMGIGDGAASSCSNAAAAAASTCHTATERPNVDDETHNTLANLGWRIRSRVNQGYSRTSTSFDPFNSKGRAGAAGASTGGFVSEQDVLQSVGNTRRAWSRVSTAPSVHSNFDGLRGHPNRCFDDDRDLHSRAGSIGAAPMGTSKRSRRASESRSEDDDAELPAESTTATQETRRRIANLPKLSFSSSASSVSSHDDSIFDHSMHPSSRLSLSPGAGKAAAAARSLARAPSSFHPPFGTLPPPQSGFHPINVHVASTAGSASIPDETAMDMDMDDGDNDAILVHGKPIENRDGVAAYDFSSHFNRTDF